MAAVANNPKFAKKVGVPKSLGEEFMKADKSKKMAKGGMHEDIKMDKKVVKKAVGMHEKQLHGGKKSDMSKLKSGGMACAPKKMARGGGIEVRGKTKGTMVKMKNGGAC
jgi:hypothetical protein